MSHHVSLILPAADSHQEELGTAAVFAFENRQVINEKFAVFLMNVRDKMLKNGVDIEKFLKPSLTMACGIVSTTPHLCGLSETLVLVILR